MRLVTLCAALALGAGLWGCAYPPAPYYPYGYYGYGYDPNAATGALVGAAGGAAIGGLAGGGQGAAIGALAGGALGAVAGANSQPPYYPPPGYYAPPPSGYYAPPSYYGYGY